MSRCALISDWRGEARLEGGREETAAVTWRQHTHGDHCQLLLSSRYP